MNNDNVISKIEEIEELEQVRKYLNHLIKEYIILEKNNNEKDIENDHILKCTKKYLKKVNGLIAQYGKEKITISLSELINNLGKSNNSINMIPNIYINVIPALSISSNKFEEIMRNSIISKFNIGSYEFDNSTINLNLFFNEDVANLYNVINAKVDVISDDVYDIDSPNVSNSISLIFYCNYGDDIIMKFVKPEDLSLTFDISELLSVNPVIKNAIMKCLNDNVKVKKLDI